MSKQELYAKRRGELTKAYADRQRLQNSSDATVQQLAEVEQRVNTLVEILKSLKEEADREAANQSALESQRGARVTVDDYKEKLKHVQKERKMLNAPKIIADAESTIKRTQKQDDELLAREMRLQKMILDLEAKY